jgi:hypothetical protein
MIVRSAQPIDDLHITLDIDGGTEDDLLEKFRRD